jgi:hypothetical protein
MRITRFLRNPAVSEAEMVATAAAGTARRVAGRHVLAIQDTTSVRDSGEGGSIVLHPTIAVDAEAGTLLGLVHAELLARRGGQRDGRKGRDFAVKQSRRWLDGTERAAGLLAAGADAVTVVADREGDIFEEFALRPEGVHLVIRAAQDRALAGGGHMFTCTAGLPEQDRVRVELAAQPGRAAREAQLALRWCRLAISRPQNRAAKGLPAEVPLTLLEAVEIDPPPGSVPAHWRLLTTHTIEHPAQARRILAFYRQRWTIEQLFRTLKTKGFDVEALRLAPDGPFEKLVTAALIAAVTVFQLVRERDGTAKRPLADALDPADQPILEAISRHLEGKTERQKNPHPTGSLAFAAWVFARLGGWTGYYGKPGPVVILHGLLRFNDIKVGANILSPGDDL